MCMWSHENTAYNAASIERERVEYVVCVLVCSELMESLVIPLQEQIDEWKKTAVHLDKDHAHGTLLVHFGSKDSVDIVLLLRHGHDLFYFMYQLHSHQIKASSLLPLPFSILSSES